MASSRLNQAHPSKQKLALFAAISASLSLASVSLAIAQQSAPASDLPAVLEGRVFHAVTKDSLRKARVTLESSEPDRDSALVATTDETGHFRFADVKPGRYTISAENAGFLDAEYHALNVPDSYPLLKVASGDHMQDLDMRLSPAASGHYRERPGCKRKRWPRVAGNRHSDPVRSDAERKGNYCWAGRSSFEIQSECQRRRWLGIDLRSG